MAKNTFTDNQQFTEGYEKYLASDRPFTEYVLDDFRNRRLVRQRVFEKAGISNGYGYKILYGEKKTQNRDLILSLCLGAEMSLPQIQTVLLLYDMPLLFPFRPRDEIIIRAVIERVVSVAEINSRLAREGCAKLSAKANS